jgi:N-acetylglutamate synthase/N-acetylornithine aminotransferase
VRSGVTYARGFRAAGVAAGLKPSGSPDLALLVGDLSYGHVRINGEYTT